MEKRPFSGRLCLDWENTVWAAMARLESKGLMEITAIKVRYLNMHKH